MWRALLNNQKISTKLFISIALPLLILLFFAGKNLYGSYFISHQMDKIDRLALFSPAITGLVHELQKERGISAGYIGSGGKSEFGNRLNVQKKRTDRSRSKFQKAAEALDVSTHGSEFSSLLSLAHEGLGKLSRIRSQVASRSLSVSDMAKYYTDTISRLIKAVSYMSHLSPDPFLSNQLMAYTSFLQAKERTGQERAMGAAGFGAGKFSPVIHKNFSRLIAQQQSFLDQFLHTATPAQIAYYKQKMSSKTVSDVLAMREIGINSLYAPQTGRLPVSAARWFDAITRKIDLMKEIEDKISADIVRYSEATATSARSSFYIILALTFGLLGLTVLFVTKVTKSIVHPVRTITCYMSRLAKGDNSRELELEKREDEIGEMMEAIEVFRQQSLERRRIERLAKIQADQFESDKAVVTIKQMALTMEELNSMAFNLGILDGQSAQVSSSSQTIASAAEQLVASVDEISANSKGAASDAVETDQTVAGGLESAQNAMGAIQVIWDTMEDSVASLEELTGASNQIEQILNVIEDIAEQTNLLALNATIEAALAGEAGKGFAVVANEVKNLANQSSKATEDIAGRIQALKQGMTNISQTMSKSRDAVTTGRGSIEDTAQTLDLAARQVSNVSARMNGITDILDQQKDSSSEIARSISEVAGFAQDSQKLVELVMARMSSTNKLMIANAQDQYDVQSDRSLCEVAKIDHIMFKKNVIDAILGRTELSPSTLSDHHGCRLGKWYDSLNLPAIRETPTFKELAVPHEQVHSAARRALEAHQAGQSDKAREAIDEMNEAGTAVLELLDKLSDIFAEQEQAKLKMSKAS